MSQENVEGQVSTTEQHAKKLPQIIVSFVKNITNLVREDGKLAFGKELFKRENVSTQIDPQQPIENLPQQVESIDPK